MAVEETVRERICSVEGCDKPHAARGMCRTHYYRWRRTENPTDIRPYRPRGSTPICTVDGCDRKHCALGFCQGHWQRYRKTGDPGSAELRPRGNSETYEAVHFRVKVNRGAASAYRCEHCGEPAGEWAYDHEDQDELRSASGPYSLDIDRYIPLCMPCHRFFDARLKGHGADRMCGVDGCDRPHVARGWCKNHYEQRRKRGDFS